MTIKLIIRFSLSCMVTCGFVEGCLHELRDLLNVLLFVGAARREQPQHGNHHLKRKKKMSLFDQKRVKIEAPELGDLEKHFEIVFSLI